MYMNTWKCTRNKTEIMWSSVCNGNTDCEDGSDETDAFFEINFYKNKTDPSASYQFQMIYINFY